MTEIEKLTKEFKKMSKVLGEERKKTREMQREIATLRNNLRETYEWISDVQVKAEKAQHGVEHHDNLFKEVL